VVGGADAALEIDVASSSLPDRASQRARHRFYGDGQPTESQSDRAYLYTNISNEPPLSIAESSGQTLTLTTVSASSLSNLSKNGPVMVDILASTIAKILDERPSPSGVEYKCELEPLWLAADLIEKAKMGRVHISEIIRMVSYRQTVWGR